MSIADKLMLLADTKEALRVKLGLGVDVPFSEYASKIATPYDPLNLFADGKKGVWYDPSDITTLFQDVAGTIPVTKDGDPVGLMKDKSGNGNHATQSVSTARPAYKGLYYDGVDDFMTMGINYPLGDFFISILVDSTYANTGGYLLGNNNATAAGAILLHLSDENGLVRFYRGVTPLVAINIHNTGMRVVTIACKGVVHSIYIDGILISSVNMPAYKLQSPLLIGKWIDSTPKHKGAVHGVLVRTGSYSDADLFNANTYLKSKSGVTL